MSASGQIFVIVRAPNGDVREFPLSETASVIGRDDSCDIRVDDRKVSRRHAAFRLIDNQPWAEDLGSVNGIKLNGKKVNQRALMLDGDVVQVGGYEVRLKAQTRSMVRADPDRTAPPSDTVGMRVSPPDTARPPDTSARLMLVGQTKPVAGRRFPLTFGESIVGRLEDCAVPILDGSVSRQHARIVLSSDAASVTDLGSSNGTFVNDVRVDRAELTDGDRLKFGSVDFRVELSSEIPSRVGPLEPSRIGRPPGKPHQGGGRGALIAGAGLVMVGAVIALGGHQLGRWRIPGLPGGAPPAVSPASDPAPTALASADPSPAVDPGTTPGPAVDPAADPAADAGPTASAPPEPSAPPAPRTPAASPPASPAPAATPALAAATPSAPAPRPAAAAYVRTATSPYGPRDASGMPTDLPAVDVGFDFEGFVAAYLARAAELEAAGRFVEMRAVITELLARDPINIEARALRRRADVAEKAANVLAQGDQLRAEGKLIGALALYGAVPADTPQGQQAKARIVELKPVAIKREMERLDIELKRDKTLPNAQRRMCAILGVDPDNEDVRKLLMALEQDMRGKGMTPAACGTGDEEEAADAGVEPSASPSASASPSPSAVPSPTAVLSRAEDIAKRWPDRTLQRIVQSYAEGDLAGAIKRADLVAKRGKGAQRTQAKDLHTNLKRAQAKYERVRNEVGNEPSVAWGQLIELGRVEAELLPAGTKSFLVQELERTIAEAFAERGAAAFEQERYDNAFTQWDSGLRLNPANAKSQQGLVRLEQIADKWVKEAELAAQRGQPDACERWRTITRMTRSSSEAHKRARARLGQGC